MSIIRKNGLWRKMLSLKTLFLVFFNFKCDSKDRKTIILNIPLFSIDHG